MQPSAEALTPRRRDTAAPTSNADVVTDALAELRELLATARTNAAAPRELYCRLYGIIARLCTDYSERLNADFSNLFSRLYAVCRAAHTDHHAIDAVRRRARLFMFGQEEVPYDVECLRTDVGIVAHFAAILYKVEVPKELEAPPHSSPCEDGGATQQLLLPSKRGLRRIQKLRAVVTTVNTPAGEFTCTSSHGDLTVSVPHLQRTLAVLTVGATVNLLDVEIIAPSSLPQRGEAFSAATPSPHGEGWGGARARLVILEPDYLIDVSGLTAAIKPYGTQAANYLFDCLTPRRETIPIMKGNAANDFMDDLVNSPKATSADSLTALYNHSLRRHFKNYLLAYACLDEPLTANYFHELRQTFDNIAESVYHRFPSEQVGMPPHGVLLEPSFICETLGLRGRFDVMAADHHTLLELKSGRADEFGHSTPQPQLAHVLQMSLYKEMLHYTFSLPRDTIRSFLFYSRYPAFFDERPSTQAVADVLELRNEIVAMEQQLREGHCDEVLVQLAPDRLNSKQLSGRFWQQYLLPQILEVYQPLKDATPLERSYFTHFLTFLEREKFANKTTDNRPDSNRGLASVWTADLETKQSTGDILIDLRLMAINDCPVDAFKQANASPSPQGEGWGGAGIELLTFALPDYGADFTPNFVCGEMVQLYERNSKQDNVCTRQLIRGYIEEMTQESLTLHLTYKQRSDLLFPTSARYAIEHDGTDSLSTQAMRGLFSLLTATPSRRTLLLAQREPEVCKDTAPTEEALNAALHDHYPATTVDIVSAARRAKDYFLLVGPPGTGKTSVALRAMVEDFLRRQSPKSHTPTLHKGEGAIKTATAPTHSSSLTTHNSLKPGLLLMAYTNRAVDEICAMLETLSTVLNSSLITHNSSLSYVRLGNPQTCAPTFRSRLATELLNDCPNRTAVCARLQEIPIVVGTVATLSAHTEIFRLRPYEAIIDEASQVLEPQILGLLCARRDDDHSAIRKFTLIGDHKQLPAVVTLPASATVVSDPQLRAIGLTDLRNSLFQRLHQLCVRSTNIPPVWKSISRRDLVAMLDHQGRMHTDISRFANITFYSGCLQPVPLPHQTASLNLTPTDNPLERFVASTRLGFINVEGENREAVNSNCETSHLRPLTHHSLSPTTSKSNAAEAEVVARLVLTLRHLYALSGNSIDVARQVGIIVPFRAQIGVIRTSLLRHGITTSSLPTIDTVECYQGSQRDFIIFSTTITQPYQVRLLSEEQIVDGLPVDRKLNVAITRARLQFFLVGNATLLRRSSLYRSLIDDYCRPLGSINTPSFNI